LVGEAEERAMKDHHGEGEFDMENHPIAKIM